MQEISEFDIYLSVYHAAVDTRSSMAERVQQQYGHRHIERTSFITVRDKHAEVVVPWTFPMRDRTWTSLRSICVYHDRRHLQKYGRESGRSSNDTEYAKMEDNEQSHTSDGKAGDTFYDTSRIRERDGKLPCAALSGTYNIIYKIRFNEFKIYRRSQYPCDNHDAFWSPDPWNQPAWT